MHVPAATQQLLQAQIHGIAARLLARDAAVQVSSPSLMAGEAGELLFWAHLGRHFNDAQVLTQVEARAARLVSSLAGGTIYHSYAGGLAGILWALQYLEHQGFIEASFDFTDVDEDIMEFVHEAFDAGDCDFLHGGTGLFAYLWQRFRQEPSARLQAHLDECVARLESLAVAQGGEAVAWRDVFTPKHRATDDAADVREYLNTGVAHGSASIVFLLSQLASRGVGGAAAGRLATAGLTWLQGLAPAGMDRLPGQFFDGVAVPAGPIAWCYGELMHAYVTLTCTKLLGLSAAEVHAARYADRVLSMVAQRLPGCHELCHGTAGVLLTLQGLARVHPHGATVALQQELVARLAALDLDAVTVPPILRPPNLEDPRDYSLLNGLAGIGLAMLLVLDEQRGVTHHWPQCLLLG